MDRRNFIKSSLITGSSELLASRGFAAKPPTSQETIPGAIALSVDFRSQKRTIKDSGLWYGRVAATNRLEV
jgi:hypothetical protein